MKTFTFATTLRMVAEKSFRMRAILLSTSLIVGQTACKSEDEEKSNLHSIEAESLDLKLGRPTSVTIRLIDKNSDQYRQGNTDLAITSCILGTAEKTTSDCKTTFLFQDQFLERLTFLSKRKMSESEQKKILSTLRNLAEGEKEHSAIDISGIFEDLAIPVLTALEVINEDTMDHIWSDDRAIFDVTSEGEDCFGLGKREFGSLKSAYVSCSPGSTEDRDYWTKGYRCTANWDAETKMLETRVWDKSLNQWKSHSMIDRLSYFFNRERTEYGQVKTLVQGFLDRECYDQRKKPPVFKESRSVARSREFMIPGIEFAATWQECSVDIDADSNGPILSRVLCGRGNFFDIKCEVEFYHSHPENKGKPYNWRAISASDKQLSGTFKNIPNPYKDLHSVVQLAKEPTQKLCPELFQPVPQGKKDLY